MDAQDNTIFHPLDHLAAVAFVGADAADFLNGQLTVNVPQIAVGQWRRAAHCSRQGRIVAGGILAHLPATADGERYIFIVRADIAEHLVQQLSRYILRAKVRARVVSDDFWAENAAAATESQAPAPGGDIGEEDGVAILSEAGVYRLFFNGGEAAADWREQINGAVVGDDATVWRRNEILRGVPWVGRAATELFIPQFVNLELLGGVDFDKGCYVGQEVIARLHYRGEVKSRSKIIYGTTAAAAETITNAAGDKVGRLLDGVMSDGRYCGLASVKLAAEGEALFIDGEVIELREPPHSPAQ